MAPIDGVDRADRNEVYRLVVHHAFSVLDEVEPTFAAIEAAAVKRALPS